MEIIIAATIIIAVRTIYSSIIIAVRTIYSSMIVGTARPQHAKQAGIWESESFITRKAMARARAIDRMGWN
jgi:hypothetical protein